MCQAGELRRIIGFTVKSNACKSHMGSKHQDSDGKNTHCDASKQEPKDQIGHVMIATAIFYIIYGLE